jgi:hypothetical protein
VSSNWPGWKCFGKSLRVHFLLIWWS